MTYYEIITIVLMVLGLVIIGNDKKGKQPLNLLTDVVVFITINWEASHFRRLYLSVCYIMSNLK